MAMDERIFVTWEVWLSEHAEKLYVVDEQNQVRKLDLGELFRNEDTKEEYRAKIEQAAEQLAELQKNGLVVFGKDPFAGNQYYYVNSATGVMEDLKKPAKPGIGGLAYPTAPKLANKPQPDYYWMKKILGVFYKPWAKEVEAYDKSAERDREEQRRFDTALNQFKNNLKHAKPEEQERYFSRDAAYQDRKAAWEKLEGQKIIDRLKKNSNAIVGNSRLQGMKSVSLSTAAYFAQQGSSSLDVIEAGSRNKDIKTVRQEMTEETRSIGAALQKSDTVDLYLREGFQPAGGDKWSGLRIRLQDEKKAAGVFRMDRSACQNLCFGMLLKEGRSLDDILNPEALKQEKEELVKTVEQHFLADDVKWITENMFEGMKAAADELEKRFNRLQTKKPAYTQEDLLEEMPYLYRLGDCAYDLNQETGYDFSKKTLLESLTDEEVERQRNRATLLGNMGKSVKEGLAAKNETYLRSMGGGEPNHKSVLTPMLKLGFVRDYMMPELADDLKKGEHVSDQVSVRNGSKLWVIESMIEVVPEVRELRETLLGCEVDGADKRLIPAAYAPLALAVRSGQLPRINDIKTENMSISINGLERLGKLKKSTESTLRKVENLVQEEKDRAQKKEQPVRNGKGPEKENEEPQMVK